MITLTAVRKAFNGKWVLNGLDLMVKKGEILTILGGSGSGKSVMLKHIVGLLRPDEGTVSIEGEEISSARGKALKRIRNKLGLVFQSGALINWMNVQQNIALPLYEKTVLGDREIMTKVDEILALLQLSGTARKMPAELSGGMKKRISIARALVMQPEILLYDEPTSGLDPVMSRRIDRIIMDMKAEFSMTSIVVTHDLSSALTISDRIAMLYHGKLIVIEAPNDFRRHNNVHVQAFISAQFGRK